MLDRPGEGDRQRDSRFRAGHAAHGSRRRRAHAELSERGVEVSEVHTYPWGSFVYFSDPDGNGWAVQQIPAR